MFTISTNLQERLYIALITGYFIGLVYSVFLLSICMIGLFALALVGHWSKGNSVLPNKDGIYSQLKAFWGRKQYSWIGLIFLGIVISGMNSSNHLEWFHHLQLKLPFLVLPCVFFLLSTLFKTKFHLILRIFIVFMCFSAIQVLVHYYANYEAITESIGMGQVIPTPCSHIRFSLFLAFAALISILQFQRKSGDSRFRWIWLVLSIFLITVLHILSVRSGLAVLYIGIAFLSFYEIITRKRVWTGLVVVTMLGCIPYIAYKTIPSFYNKVSYSLWDLQMYRSGQGKNYSDSGRLYSLHAGWNIFKEDPIMGTGIGDLKEACQLEYEKMFDDPPSVTKYPHNQFLFTLAGMGLLGLILFLLGYLAPLLFNRAYKDIYLLLLYVIISSSFLVENTFERSNGIAFFLIFLLLGLNYLSEQKD